MCELDFKILIFFNLKKKLLRLPIYFAHVICLIRERVMRARRPPQFVDHFENRSQLVHPPEVCSMYIQFRI